MYSYNKWFVKFDKLFYDWSLIFNYILITEDYNCGEPGSLAWTWEDLFPADNSMEMK